MRAAILLLSLSACAVDADPAGHYRLCGAWAPEGAKTCRLEGDFDLDFSLTSDGRLVGDLVRVGAEATWGERCDEAGCSLVVEVSGRFFANHDDVRYHWALDLVTEGGSVRGDGWLFRWGENPDSLYDCAQAFSALGSVE